MRVLKFFLGAVVLAAIGVLAVLAFIAGRRELQQEQALEAPVKVPARLSRTAEGEVVVVMDAQAQARVGLQTAPLAARTLRPERAAYGVLEADPADRFVVRAPIAGTMRCSDSWPRLGDVLEDRTVIGRIEPVLGPVQRVDLASRLAEARAEIEEIQATLSAAQASLDHKRALNAQNKIVPDRTLEAEAARVKSLQARLGAARRTADLLEASLSPTTQASQDLPLVVQRGGQVVGVPARPGETVGSGQAILELTRFDHLIARVQLPIGQIIASAAPDARIVVAGFEDHPLPAKGAVAAAARPAPGGQSFLFRVEAGGLALRPGMAVTAYLAPGGRALRGVDVPRSAVVRLAGGAWAYVQQGRDRFVRTPVPLDYPTADGWLAVSGFTAGQRVVVVAPQVLVSEELKSEIQVGEEAGGD